MRQKEVDSRKTQSQRNQMGQFSTPYSLANEIVRYTRSLLAEEQDVSFIEPALGTGVFFSALEANVSGSGVSRATGVEVDAEYANVAAETWAQRPFEIVNSDFVGFSASADRRALYSLLCTNPPYVRHHHLSASLKAALQKRIGLELQLRPSGLSGLYVYFVLLSHPLLARGALASWLIPSEFLMVNYGRVLREYLLKRVQLKRIHQYDPADAQFDDALVSSCVVTYVMDNPSGSYEFEFSFGGTLDKPRQIRIVNSASLTPAEKWSFGRIGSDSSDEPKGIRLGDIFDIKRGIATGANGFFIVDQAVIREYSIPARFLKPILPSPRYLRSPVIRADADGSPAISGAKYLLDCDFAPDMVRTAYPGLWRYLELGESQGIPESYLGSRRRFWYLQEQREPALYMVTYMSRGRSKNESPFRFFLNLSNAIGANVFLLLYPKPSIKALLDGDEDRMLALLEILNGLARDHVLDGGRTYGGGLHKLEPRELANLRIDSAPAWLQLQIQPELALVWTK